jgi:hypothetical protein
MSLGAGKSKGTKQDSHTRLSEEEERNHGFSNNYII